MKLLRLNSVIDSTGMGRSTIYKYMADGSFPKPVSLGARSVAWVESEVHEWISNRIKIRDNLYSSNTDYSTDPS
ncbi:AlpA family transcriptional regulator [Shewanella sp. 5_MG-2023]|uniref:AlpA family transcriptional regulator n=1 Tax=Shewanella sp. 5_MG-2023 TaxID=3062656 RepID=UPI0026E39280|nr:AlpA family transcriptional regulator [Shewanella sp. 5_MG-2023]MDO6639763.1 AlpA family transcriptional regulator [Shewanella sp. 5_MG-2023]